MKECSLDLLKEMSEKYKSDSVGGLVRLHMHPNTVQKIKQKLDERYIKTFDELVRPNKYIKEDEIFKIKEDDAYPFKTLKMEPQFVRPPPRSNEFDLYERLLQDRRALAVALPPSFLIRDVAAGSSYPYKKYKNTMSLKAFNKFIKRK